MSDAALLSFLFMTSFAAATLIPAQSEAVLAGLLTNSDIAPWILILVASTGNIAGSCINWALGRYAETFKTRRWFPVNEDKLLKAQSLYRRYGRWLLLLSWVPFIGDPITVAAGVMKEKFSVFLVLVSLSKTGRYIALAFLLDYAAASL